MKPLELISIFFLTLVVGTVIGQAALAAGLSFYTTMVLGAIVGVAIGLITDKVFWKSDS